MTFSRKVNVSTVIAVLFAFCFVTAFSADASVALRGGRNLLSDKIDTFRCDLNNQRITSTISKKTEEIEGPGFEIRICFEATRLATTNNFSILKIDDFSFTKDRTNGDLAAGGPTLELPLIMRQKTLDSGVPESSDITRIFCNPGAKVCAFETILTGYFFLTSGPIQGKGSMLMQRGGNANRQDLQDMDDFEDVYIEIDFTGGGRPPMEPGTKRVIIIISVVVVLLLICCCCGLIICCMAGICCFAGRDKREEIEEEDIEEVSVNLEYAPATKNSEKGDDDLSETESLEDDQYWDDDINLTDDENELDFESVNDSEDEIEPDDDVEIENLESVTSKEEVVRVPVPYPPFQDSEEEAPQEKSKRTKSKRNSNKSLKTEETRDNSAHEEDLYVEDDTEEVVAIPDPEESPKKKKKKKKKKAKIVD